MELGAEARDTDVAALRQRPAAPEEMSLPRLVAHVVKTHHAFTRAELERAEGLIVAVAKERGTRSPEFVELVHVFESMRVDLLVHLHKEEHILFSHLVALDAAKAENRPRPKSAFSSVRYPVQVMYAEHVGHGHGLDRLRTLTREFAPPEGASGSHRSLFDCLRDLEADLRLHVALENHVLFPRALDLEASFG
ncbi:MAG: hemerythrin domain-containing protein [Polyangiales bacterium]